MRKLVLTFIGLLFCGTLASSAYIAVKAVTFLRVPPETPGQEIFITVEPGATFYEVAEDLHAKGLIRNVQYFRLLARWKKALGSIQAGEFSLNTGWLPQRILETLVSGQPILYKLAIREGLTWWETAKIVEEAGYADVEDFARVIRDKDLLARHKVPFDTAEGFLFPETYLLKRPGKKDARPIVELLLKTFWERAAKVWDKGEVNATELGRTVILASMVEKETGVASERPRVAGVYVARLARNMLMQCDPTVIYGLGTAFDGNLTQKHLQDAANPYNTYRRAGLPPGPICSPGLASLKAAALPEVHDYLYFVSRNDGTHYFSKNLAEHNRAVREYQLSPRRKRP